MTAIDLPAPTSERRTPASHRRTRRPLRSRFVDGVLSVLALGGVLCIIAVICAFVFNITLIMFKSGSMAPTIPTGSLAVVRELPAAQVHVGDVTTIERPGQLPVTHRITAIEPAGGDTYSIRMKGDANDADDPSPYVVSTVRKVLWSVDGLGFVVAKAQRPAVLAVTTLAMATLVTWAFWPRHRPASAEGA